MVATAHVPVGAVIVVAIGSSTQYNPAQMTWAMLLCLASHLALDSIAHTDPKHLRRPTANDTVGDEPLWWELPSQMLDVAIATAIALSLWWYFDHNWWVLAGALIAALPDAIWAPPLEKRFRNSPLIKEFTDFHDQVCHFPLRPSQWKYGILPQVATIVLSLAWLLSR